MCRGIWSNQRPRSFSNLKYFLFRFYWSRFTRCFCCHQCTWQKPRASHAHMKCTSLSAGPQAALLLTTKHVIIVTFNYLCWFHLASIGCLGHHCALKHVSHLASMPCQHARLIKRRLCQRHTPTNCCHASSLFVGNAGKGFLVGYNNS